MNHACRSHNMMRWWNDMIRWDDEMRCWDDMMRWDEMMRWWDDMTIWYDEIWNTKSGSHFDIPLLNRATLELFFRTDLLHRTEHHYIVKLDKDRIASDHAAFIRQMCFTTQNMFDKTGLLDSITCLLREMSWLKENDGSTKSSCDGENGSSQS